MVTCSIRAITGTKFEIDASREDTVIDLLRRIDREDTTGDVVYLFNSGASYKIFSSGDAGIIDTAFSAFALMEHEEVLGELNYEDPLGAQIGDEMDEAEATGSTLTFLISAAMVGESS